MKTLNSHFSTAEAPFQIEPSWDAILEDELHSSYFKELMEFLDLERKSNDAIYPPSHLMFNAFLKTPFEKVKVVLLGQDPYHGPGQAEGLSFSVPKTVLIPPSLKNIFKELKSDVGFIPPNHGSLTHWAEQGVLLLNAILTVKQNTPLAHQKKGWERFTDAVIKKILDKKDSVVFLLWGKYAQDKCSHFSSTSSLDHLLLTASHPSPFSAHQGFFGCRHFSKTNQFLIGKGKKPIDWQLPID